MSEMSLDVKTRKIKRCLRNTGWESGQQGERLNLETAQLTAFSKDATHMQQIMGRWVEGGIQSSLKSLSQKDYQIPSLS